MMTPEERMKYLNDLAKSGKDVPMLTGLQTDPEKNTWSQAAGDAADALYPEQLVDKSKQMFEKLRGRLK